MRWRTGDTCLSAASCVPCPPPLAAIRKLSGTIPASPALLSGSSPRTPHQQKRQATSPAARLDPFTASRFPPPPPPQPGTPPSPHHSTPHTNQNGEPPRTIPFLTANFLPHLLQIMLSNRPSFPYFLIFLFSSAFIIPGSPGVPYSIAEKIMILSGNRWNRPSPHDERVLHRIMIIILPNSLRLKTIEFIKVYRRRVPGTYLQSQIRCLLLP